MEGVASSPEIADKYPDDLQQGERYDRLINELTFYSKIDTK